MKEFQDFLEVYEEFRKGYDVSDRTNTLVDIVKDQVRFVEQVKTGERKRENDSKEVMLDFLVLKMTFEIYTMTERLMNAFETEFGIKTESSLADKLVRDMRWLNNYTGDPRNFEEKLHVVISDSESDSNEHGIKVRMENGDIKTYTLDYLCSIFDKQRYVELTKQLKLKLN